MEGMEDEIFENGGVSTCAWVARPITWRGLVMYLDMVVPPGGILARISPEDGGQLPADIRDRTQCSFYILVENSAKANL